MSSEVVGFAALHREVKGLLEEIDRRQKRKEDLRRKLDRVAEGLRRAKARLLELSFQWVVEDCRLELEEARH